MNCPLCNTEATLFEIIHTREYFKCEHCGGIFLNPIQYLSSDKEKERYLEHENDVEDAGYQNFVRPLVSKVLLHQDSNDKGLDFGSGTGPVITKLLREQQFNIVTWDPFFDNKPERLQTTYDYIVSCEVMEHFHHPHKEFKLLHSLLNSNGNLFCKTDIFNETIDFKKWYYKDDPTHVFIYSEKTLHWIQKEFNFKSVQVENRTIHFKK